MYQIFEELQKKSGKTIYRISKETGIATSIFYNWKAGRSTPKVGKLMKIADCFGVSVTTFLEKRD